MGPALRLALVVPLSVALSLSFSVPEAAAGAPPESDKTTQPPESPGVAAKRRAQQLQGQVEAGATPPTLPSDGEPLPHDPNHHHDTGKGKAVDAGPGAHDHDHDHAAEKAQRQALGQQLSHQLDPNLEAPAGLVLIYAAGEGMKKDRAAALEAAILAALHDPALEPVTMLAVKPSIPGLDNECEALGACGARVAAALGAKLVLGATRKKGGVIRLELTDLERAEVLASAEIKDDAALPSALAAMLEQATPPPPPPEPAVPPVLAKKVAPATWQLFATRVPFYVSVALMGVGLVAAGYTSLAYSAAFGDYERAATGREVVLGRDLLSIRSRVESRALVAQAMWGVTAGLTVVSAAIAVFTDWSGSARVAVPDEDDDDNDNGDKKRKGIRIGVAPAPGGASAFIGGSF